MSTRTHPPIRARWSHAFLCLPLMALAATCGAHAFARDELPEVVVNKKVVLKSTDLGAGGNLSNHSVIPEIKLKGFDHIKAGNIEHKITLHDVTLSLAPYQNGSKEELSWDKTATTSPAIRARWDRAAGVLRLHSKAGAAADQFEKILQTVKLTADFASASLQRKVVTINVGPGMAHDVAADRHYYRFIETDKPISWKDAKTAAESKELAYFGVLPGYLATITSQHEMDFIQKKLKGHGWIGGRETNNVWRWVTGPEGERGEVDLKTSTAKGQIFTYENSGAGVDTKRSAGLYYNWSGGGRTWKVGDEHSDGGLVASVDPSGTKGYVVDTADNKHSLVSAVDFAKADPDGWHLTTIVELREIYKNLKNHPKANFRDTSYFASDVSSASNHRGLNLKTGAEVTNLHHGDKHPMRFVRDFSGTASPDNVTLKNGLLPGIKDDRSENCAYIKRDGTWDDFPNNPTGWTQPAPGDGKPHPEYQQGVKGYVVEYRYGYALDVSARVAIYGPAYETQLWARAGLPKGSQFHMTTKAWEGKGKDFFLDLPPARFGTLADRPLSLNCRPTHPAGTKWTAQRPADTDLEGYFYLISAGRSGCRLGDFGDGGPIALADKAQVAVPMGWKPVPVPKHEGYYFLENVGVEGKILHGGKGRNGTQAGPDDLDALLEQKSKNDDKWPVSTSPVVPTMVPKPRPGAVVDPGTMWKFVKAAD